mmetsp:Transcript_52638/g.125754  ORF Transcript_52638/g.125754 Transcript_52638/m.125754 type:complete len:203 (+) Transcript_52638:23-631(+)
MQERRGEGGAVVTSPDGEPDMAGHSLAAGLHCIRDSWKAAHSNIGGEEEITSCSSEVCFCSGFVRQHCLRADCGYGCLQLRPAVSDSSVWWPRCRLECNQCSVCAAGAIDVSQRSWLRTDLHRHYLCWCIRIARGEGVHGRVLGGYAGHLASLLLLCHLFSLVHLQRHLYDAESPWKPHPRHITRLDGWDSCGQYVLRQGDC